MRCRFGFFKIFVVFWIFEWFFRFFELMLSRLIFGFFLWKRIIVYVWFIIVKFKRWDVLVFILVLIFSMIDCLFWDGYIVVMVGWLMLFIILRFMCDIVIRVFVLLVEIMVCVCFFLIVFIVVYMFVFMCLCRVWVGFVFIVMVVFVCIMFIVDERLECFLSCVWRLVLLLKRRNLMFWFWLWLCVKLFKIVFGLLFLFMVLIDIVMCVVIFVFLYFYILFLVFNDCLVFDVIDLDCFLIF